MLEELAAIHLEVMATTSTTIKRYLYDQINWKASSLCILGDRGVGKTTMMCQHLLENYSTPDRALYISADHINVLSYGLFNIAKQFFSEGGETLYIDEVHKYPSWSIELKNIIDTYKGKKLVFSASSSLDLKKSKADLSRRVVYHRLVGLSFREYLLFSNDIKVNVLDLVDLLKNHLKIASSFHSIPMLKHFKNYLRYGYYPFFLEGIEDYLFKVNNVIEKVIFEDIAVNYNLKQTTLPILKKILWLVATSSSFTPNIDRMSKSLGISREMIYNSLEYLNSSGLLNDLFYHGRGLKLIRKPGKIFLNNTNLLHAINGVLELQSDIGNIRETFFVNQMASVHKINLHNKADFIINDQHVIEVGGKGKNNKQIKGVANSHIAIDDISVGFGRKIPLYLFGMLY